MRAKLRINNANSSPGERPNLPQIETADCVCLPFSLPPLLSFVSAFDSHCERVNCCHKVYAGWMSALKSACACKHHIKTSRGDRHASPASPGSESARGAENIPLPSCPPTAAPAAALDHRCCSDFGLTHGLPLPLPLPLPCCGCNMSFGNNLCSLRSHKLIASKCSLFLSPSAAAYPPLASSLYLLLVSSLSLIN